MAKTNGDKGIFEGYIIFSDLDGTLVDEAKNIPENNLSAIEYFKANGGLFTIASGRCALSIKDYAEKIKVNCPLVTLNGAVTYDLENNIVVSGKSLPPHFLKFVEDVMENFPEVGIQCYVGSEIYTAFPNHITEELLVIEALSENKCDKGELPSLVNKLLIGGEPEVLSRLAQYHAENPTEGMYGMMTSKVYYEILPNQTHKGFAALELAEKLGIEKSKVFAVGDFYNDIDLLKSVGYPIVTDNAPDDVKIYGKYITCHCKDGAIDDAIRHIEALICAKA